MKPIKTTMADIEQAKERYAAEAEARWGHTDAWQESQRHKKSPAQQQAAAQEMDAIFAAFARLTDKPADDPALQALVKRWQDYISSQYYSCTKAILAGLGEMYLADERFTENLDRFGPGTANIMSQAIAHYCKS